MALADRSATGSPSAAAPFLPGAAGVGAGAGGAYSDYNHPAPAFASSGHRESYSTLDMATVEPMGYATPDYGNNGGGGSGVRPSSPSSLRAPRWMTDASSLAASCRPTRPTTTRPTRRPGTRAPGAFDPEPICPPSPSYAWRGCRLTPIARKDFSTASLPFSFLIFSLPLSQQIILLIETLAPSLSPRSLRPSCSFLQRASLDPHLPFPFACFVLLQNLLACPPPLLHGRFPLSTRCLPLPPPQD